MLCFSGWWLIIFSWIRLMQKIQRCVHDWRKIVNASCLDLAHVHIFLISFAPKITDYTMLPDTGCLSEHLRVCLQEGDENPRDFTSLFDMSLFNLSTDTLPQVIRWECRIKTPNPKKTGCSVKCKCIEPERHDLLWLKKKGCGSRSSFNRIPAPQQLSSLLCCADVPCSVQRMV